MLSLKATTLDFLNSAPEPHLAPINLAHHTNQYTVRRAEEYVAHRRSISGWMDTRRDPPEYISQLRECPCGSALPARTTTHFQARNLRTANPGNSAPDEKRGAGRVLWRGESLIK